MTQLRRVLLPALRLSATSAGVVALGAVMLHRRRASHAPATSDDQAAPLPVSSAFVEFEPLPESLELEPGGVYVAQVDVPFLAEPLVSESAIRRGLELEQFIPLRVSEDRPPWWPSNDAADWYLLVSYSGARRPRNVPSSITRAWHVEA